MIAPEADPDVVRWGFNLLYGDDSNMNHDIFNIQLNAATPYHGNYATAPQFPTEPSNVESDEMIAYTLQQDELAVEPVAGSQHSEEQNGSVLTDDDIPCQQFCEQGARHSENQEESSHENEDDNCCSSSDGSGDDNDETCTSLDLLEESSVLDGEVGKRLTHLNSVPHVPRTNRDIPSIDEVTSDHQRLLDRLQLYDLTELKIHGDGNCQFRALCDQFYRTPEHHKFVREQVVNQLKSNPELYQEYVPMPYDEYLKKIAKNGEWGDHVTLQAAADCYGVKICIVTSFKDTCFIEILPNIQRSKRVIFLSFWAEVHYNSIYPDGDVPDFSETKRKKRWWSFGSKN